MGVGLSPNLEHGINLYGDTERQIRRTDGKARMFAAFAERIDHQVGCAVDDGGHLIEIRRAIDEAAEFDAADDPVLIPADSGERLGQNIQRAGTGGILAVFNSPCFSGS